MTLTRAVLVAVPALLATQLAAKDFKIGFVDSDEIVAGYQAAREAKEELDAEIAGFRAHADSLRLEFEQAKDEYQSQELSLSEEGKRAKLAEVDQRKRRYDSYLDQVYREGGKIDQKNQELIAPIVEKINEAVDRIAKDEGFTLVLDAAKTEIVFSEPGLDLTDLVLDDLNRGYAPAGPAEIHKIVYAVFPIFEGNDEAKQERTGEQIRRFVYDLAGSRTTVEMVANAEINRQLQEQGKLERELMKEDVVAVASPLDADYAIIGKCIRSGRKVEFELSICDVRMNDVVRTESGTAAREDDLNPEVARVAQALLGSVEK